MIDPTDHRRLGVELNNALWDRIAEGSLTPELPDADRQELLYAACASTYHWIQAGDAANRARGEHLISRVAVALGYHDLASTHANRCLELVEANPDVTEDWDLAFAHEAVARAAAANGWNEDAGHHRRLAVELTARIEDDGDRGVLEAELAREPWFGFA